MVSIFNSSSFNKLLLSGVLVTFSMAVITPSPAYAQINIGFNDVTFALNMKDLVQKVWKYQEREDTVKLLDTVLDIKQQTEGYAGIHFNIDQELDKAEREIKNRGGKIAKKEMQAVRKFIKKKEKKQNQRKMCMASYLQDSPSITFEEYEFLHRAAHGHDKEDKEEQEIRDLPVRLTIGVTMILAGGFLCGVGVMLKIPVCVTYGEGLMIGGVNFAIDGYANRQEEDKNKEKDKRK